MIHLDDSVDMSCDNCKHLTGAICKAFPIEIPSEISMDEISHIDPYPGDNGIQFEFKEKVKDYFVKLEKEVKLW